jgi:hypothetical protein
MEAPAKNRGLKFKFCSKIDCPVKTEQPAENFGLRKDRNSLKPQCKTCDRIKRMKWHKEHPTYSKDWHIKNPNYNKDYYQKNRSRIDKANKNSDWEKKNGRAYHKEYYNKNKKDLLTKNILYCKKRRNLEPEFRMTYNLRRRLNLAIRGKCKSANTLNLIGCSWKFLITHLERRFYNNPRTGEPMTWDNYSLKGWHVDHIIPCIEFDLLNPEEQRKCFHYTNLQPLWAEDNLRKADKTTNNKGEV